MLIELKISNFAIVKEQKVSFSPGLNVITGETGSGKSIILSALELLLGARPRAHFIRSGAESMEIEGKFDLTRVGQSVLHELPEIAKGKDLRVIRTMNQSGKSKVLVNGKATTISTLEEISQKIINICGQGQQMRLLEPRYHLECIDDFADLNEEVQSFKSEYEAYLIQKERLDQIKGDESKRSVRLQDLTQIIEDLTPLALSNGSRQELEDEIKRIEGGEKLILGGEDVLENLKGEDGVLKSLFEVISKMNEMLKWDKSLNTYISELSSARIVIQETSRELESYIAKVENDPETLEDLRVKLAEISRLERKYRRDDRALAELLIESQDEHRALSSFCNFEKLEEELSKVEAKLLKQAGKISLKRRAAAKQLVKAVESDLHDVNMSDARLEVEFEEVELNRRGIDQIELLIASNKGEPFKPLRQVASGGELSRIMLVLKKNLRDRAGVNVLVFDEVDTGVSGKVARAVGEKLSSLAENGQVICITHLPQIASLADHHLLVDKQVGDRAISVVREISGDQQVDEIARMLAGYTVTDATRESARELLASKR